MRTLQLNKHETLCVPDQNADLGQMATYDTTGWVQIGRMGSADSLLIDKAEWLAFVNLVNELDTHMALGQSGAYTPTVDESEE